MFPGPLRRTFLLFLTVGTFCVAAGEARGTLTVTVTNNTKAPVADAAVKAVRIQDSKESSLKTDARGMCVLDLPVGTYCLTVRAAGYQPDFIGGAIVRAQSDFPLRFALYPGDPNKKLPHEKTPAERAAELAKAHTGEVKAGQRTPGAVMTSTLDGLDEPCRVLQIKRTNGGPSARAARVAEAVAALRKRDYAGALKSYKQAVGEDGTDPNCWFNCGVLLHVQRQAQLAEVCFRTAIGLCGGGGDALFHSNLGRALGSQGKMQASEKAFNAAMIIDPTKEGLFLYELACVYHARRDFKKAVELFRKAIAKKCPDPLVYFAYGNALEMQGKGKEASEPFKRFMQLSVKDPTLADYRARTEKKLKRIESTGR